jgi:orotidine-5'-phosphate decarboxylase
MEARGQDRLIFALDVPARADAEPLLDELAGHVGVAKIGLELFVAEGAAIVRSARERDFPVFLDLKLHDIPETVERAVARACDLDVTFLTVHASGGPKMLERAVARTRGTNTRIVAVTVLTSLDASDLRAIGIERAPYAHAALLAEQAQSAGVSNFVCSPHEVSALRRSLSPSAVLITPGVRPTSSDAGDQKRTATADAAIRAGADYVVVGRPIRDATDRVAAADAIAREIATAFARRAAATTR